MKKLLLSLSLLFSISALSGCDSGNKEMLTYGTLYHESYVSIDADTVYSKKEQENFLLATYGDTTCDCWSRFQNVLNYITKNDHLLTYAINNEQIDDRLNSIGIKNSDSPALYFIASKKVIRRTFYADNSDIFNDERLLKAFIQDTMRLPIMYFINEEQIQTEVIDKGGILYYTRLSCPDCSYCTPNVVMPYIRYRDDKTFCVFDLDTIRPTNKDDVEGQERYQKFKDDHFLSNKYNKDFGYDTGFVPTFQYYQDGELYDMAVFFNDEVTDMTITKSYYDEERAKHIHYVVNLIRKVLVGTKLSSYEINESGNWVNQKAHSGYYEPFIEAFFDFYYY